MRAAIYVRISKEDQSNYSLISQIEECKKYIADKGHALTEVYTEDGYSAKNMKRPALQRMLADLSNKKFDIIVIWRLDRLTRNTLDGLNMVTNIFRPHGVEFASVTEDIDTSTPDGYMMFTIRLSMAQNEREKIKERTTLGQRKRAQAGLRNTIAKPYGYNIDKSMRLTVNEEEAEVVRRIYRWYIEGHGRQKIANMLNDEGVPPARNKLWFHAIIGALIGNVTHIGANHWKRKEDPEENRIIVHGMHEPIVDRELFDSAVEIKKKRKDGDMSQSSYDFVFSSIVKCGECGRSYHGKKKATVWRTQTYNYRCSGMYRSNNCKASDISEIKLTKLFLDFIKGFDLIPAVPDKVVGGRDLAKERKKLEKLLADSIIKKDRYTRAWGSNIIDYEKFLELMGEESGKQKHWQLELDEINMQTPTHKKKHSDIAKGIEEIGSTWNRWTVLEKKMALYGIFKYIVIKKVNNVWNVAGFMLN